MNHQKRLYNALKSECEANINEALLTLDLCFYNGVAIGEHTSEHFMEETSKALGKLTDGLKELKQIKIKKKQNIWLCILMLVQEKHTII